MTKEMLRTEDYARVSTNAWQLPTIHIRWLEQPP